MNLGKPHKLLRQAPFYKVNGRCLIATIVCVAAITPAVIWWHAHALYAVAESLFERANALEADVGDKLNGREAADHLTQASRLLWNYVQFRPDDPRGKVRLAEVFAKSPEGLQLPRRRAAELYRDAIAVADPKDSNRLRLQLAETLLASNLVNEAATTVLQWIQSPEFRNEPDSPYAADAWRILANSLAGQIEAGGLSTRREASLAIGMSVGEVVEKAVSYNPKHPELAISLADLYRRDDRDRYLSQTQKTELAQQKLSPVEKADEMVEKALQQNPDDPTVFVAGFVYKERYGIDSAFDNLQHAFDLDPQAENTNILMGSWFMDQANKLDRSSIAANPANPQDSPWRQAKSHFETAIQADPKNQWLYLNLGEACYRLKESGQAIQTWEKGVDEKFLGELGEPTLDVYPRLIGALIEDGQFDNADHYFDGYHSFATRQARAASGNPRRINEAFRTETLLHGIYFLKQKKYGLAIDDLLRAASIASEQKSERARAYKLLGDIFTKLGSADRAAHYYESCATLVPSDPEFCRLAAESNVSAGHTDRADALYETLVSLSQSPEDLLRYASFLLDSQMQRSAEYQNWGRLEQVVSHLEELVKAQPIEKPWRVAALRITMQLAKSQAAKSDGAHADPNTASDKVNPGLADLDQISDTDPDLCKQLVWWHLALGDSERVQALLKQFQTLAGSTADAYLLPALVAIRQGDTALAAATFQKGITEVASDADRLSLEMSAARLEATQLKFDDALARLKRLIVEFPSEPSIILTTVDWMIQLDRIDADVEPWEEQLPDIEGKNGPLSRVFERETTDP